MNFQPYMTVQVVFITLVVLFLIRETLLIKQRPQEDRKTLYFLQIILLIGVLVRTLYLSYPYGLNVDEAIGGYDAWCLANYGVDSNLASYPVYLKSWGSGQSALYVYLSLPFVKIFGLSEPVFRLPMSLISSFTLLFFYYTLRKTQKDAFFIFCISAFLAINPWHILKSRVGLDCNIFPDILLVGICFIILGYYCVNKIRKNAYFSVGFIVIAISAYGYAVGWMVLPFIVFLLICFLYKNKQITLYHCTFFISILFLVCLPLLLFACNLFDKNSEQYQLGIFTITKLSASRHEATTIFGNPDLLVTSWGYFKEALKILVQGSNNSFVFAFFPFGVFYNLISIPFLLIGLKKYKEEDFKNINLFLGVILISAIPVLLFVSPDLSHWNVIWFSLIYFSGYGIYLALRKAKQLKFVFLYIYGISFVFFINSYIKSDFINNISNTTHYKKEFLFSQELTLDKIYYPWDMVHSYLVFYNPIDPYIFAETRKDNGDAIALVYSYDNIVIGYPDGIHPLAKTGYLVPTDLLPQIDLSQYKIHKGNYYSVIWND